MTSNITTTLVAGGFVILAAVISGIFVLGARRRPKSKLRVVDSGSSRPPDRTSVVEGAQPPAVSTRLGVEVVEADVPSPGYAMDHPVVDVKFQNSGGRDAYLTRMEVRIIWARKYRVLEDLIPYLDTSGPLHIPPSAMYDVDLPEPPATNHERIEVGISQSIAAGESDRILVRLKTEVQQTRFSPYSQPSETSLYILRLTFYNGDGKQAETREVGAACPGNVLYVPTILGLRRNIYRFEEMTRKIRDRVDEKFRERGEPTPDWDGAMPLGPDDFEAEVESLDRVNEAFWSPGQAILEYLDEAEFKCRELVDSLRDDMPDSLDRAREAAQRTLCDLPGLRDEMSSDGPFHSG